MPERSEKICVVDDDMSLLKALDRLLGSAGLQTLPFNDPRLFLEHVRNHPVALAILDVSMRRSMAWRCSGYFMIWRRLPRLS
jgi:FixJ family two-component response regulator